jgi:hypothetical protein
MAVALAIILMADLIYVGWSLRAHLQETQSFFAEGRSALIGGDYDAALRNFEMALEEARRASTLEARPGAWALRITPGISSDARAAAKLSTVAELAARAGLDAVSLYERLGATSAGLAGALFDRGRVRMDSMGIALDGVDGLTSLLSEADELLHADLDPRIASIQDAWSRARSQVSKALTVFRRAATLLAAAPSLFGETAERRYLLLIQNPSQSRSSGGLIEYYGVLSVSDGRFKLDSISPISLLQNGSGGWSSINKSPDFPAVARSALSQFRAATGRHLDGVIATDPLALQQMTRATGPFRERGYDVVISSQNAAQVLMHDVFEHFEGATSARHQYTSAVVEQVFKAVTKGIGDSSSLLDALGNSAETQHLKIYSAIGDAQGALGDLGVSGDPRLFGPSVQMVTQNSLVSSQVDFFLRRAIKVLIELGEDGSARVTTTATIENRAPDGPASPVLGSEQPGQARLSLGALLPESASTIQYEGGGGENPRVSSGVDQRRPFRVELSVPPGSIRRVSFSYQMLPSTGTGEGPTFELLLLPQGLAFPDLVTVNAIAPPGFCVNSCDRPTKTAWGATKTLSEPWRVTVRRVQESD